MELKTQGLDVYGFSNHRSRSTNQMGTNFQKNLQLGNHQFVYKTNNYGDVLQRFNLTGHFPTFLGGSKNVLQ